MRRRVAIRRDRARGFPPIRATELVIQPHASALEPATDRLRVKPTAEQGAHFVYRYRAGLYVNIGFVTNLH